MDDRLRHTLRAEAVGEPTKSDDADVRMMRGNETVAPRVEFESEALRRNEALRQRGQLSRDVQELRFRPVWTDELYADR
jgi:hypothetical protein